MIQLKRIVPVALSGLLAVAMIGPEMEEPVVSNSAIEISSGSGEMIAQAPVPGQRRRVRRRTRRRVNRRQERRNDKKSSFISVSGNYIWNSQLV